MRTIALLTDFGTRDPYVAAVKGVLASRCDARIADLSHEIAPFDVWEAAFFLRAAVPYWPAQTIFMVVVDPGVGTERRIIAVEHDDRVFLAPDNGVLSLVAAPPAVSVENDRVFLPDGSTTFHGRDRFAPAAAAIAMGKRLDTLGPRVETLVSLPYEPPAYDPASARGTIVAVDRFGNLITDVEPVRLASPRFALRAGGHTIARTATSYAGGGTGAFLVIGSTGCIEISVAGASAAALLHLRRGDRVVVTPA